MWDSALRVIIRRTFGSISGNTPCDGLERPLRQSSRMVRIVVKGKAEVSMREKVAQAWVDSIVDSCSNADSYGELVRTGNPMKT